MKKKKKRDPNTVLWKLVSEYVRRQYGEYTNCVTCKKLFHWKEIQAGHYIHSGFKNALYNYSTININPQCAGCNMYKSGDLPKYAIYLKERYGAEIINDVYLLTQRRLTVDELEERILFFKDKIEELTN